ncbi:type I glyceraldehyde-3-phosphate dehydrogenase [Patescibacteria group bacterium]|nr:type I glyceraldehyde-3-phosphate dehydrogenase [Patescibacteria group bacterium]
MTKIAINGFGRIGRPTFRRILDYNPPTTQSKLDVVAINDLTSPATLAHLLRYDSLYGIYDRRVKFSKSELLLDGTAEGKKVKIFAAPDPEKLPWKELGVDIVLECTGFFTDLEGAKKHLKAGAKKVIISANAKTEEIPHFVLGVNEEKYNPKNNNIVAMCSCTTNCLAPVAKVLNKEFGIEKGFMTTVHSYTNTQRILDLSHKNLREARAAAINIIPTTTGAVKAVVRVLPELKGKLDGLALRVPTPTVSIVDFVCIVKKETTAEEVNYLLKKASKREELRGILGVEDAPLVSSDYKGNSYSAIVDALSTQVQGNLLKVLVWYDNEWAYACRLAEFAEFIGKKL